MNILDTIGKTPLILLEQISKEAGANIYVKLETFNPGGSIKDRASYAYLTNALERGEITKGDTVLEASSGNLAIGLALVCKQLGLQLTACMPETASIERRKLIKALGATIMLSPAALGMKGAIAFVDELEHAAHVEGQKVFRPNQFQNEDGPKLHYEVTGPEIAAFTKENDIKLHAFVAGVGSGATFTGVGRYLKEIYPKIFLCPVEPEESAVISGKKPAPHGIQGIGAGFVPDILDKKLINETLTVSTEDAIAMAQRLFKEEGLNVGISSGANVLASFNLAKRSKFQGKNILTFACDTGERYMSTALFPDDRRTS